MKSYVGVDVGTSGCRVVAYAEDRRVLAEATREYPVLTPAPGWAEQDPEAVLAALLSALGEVLAHPALEGDAPRAVGLANAMHSLVALDGEGNLLSNAIIWADLRAAEDAARLKAEGLADAFYRRTGCPVHPMYLPAKVRWLMAQAPFAPAVRRVATLKDYLIWRLTGRWALDHSSASATGLLNLETLAWDEAVLQAVGLAAEALPELVDPLASLSGFTTPLARAYGLPPDVPVVAGATDGTLSNLGAGVLAPGQVAVMIGTSAAARATAPQPLLDPKARTWCYYLLPGLWIPGGAINNGGNILQWYRDRLGAAETADARARGLDPYAELSARAAAVPPGSRGLVCLPFLAGERSPGWNPQARGVFFGLSLTHGPDEVVRSLMEGVAFQLFSVFEALTELTGPPAEVRATGGFTRSRTWLQIVADVFGVPLALPEVAEGSAFGAAALAQLAVGDLGGLAEVAAGIRIGGTVEPRDPVTRTYRELYELYLDLYRKLGPDFAGIAGFQAGERGNTA
ncbi:MAG: gluconokinase [Chitinophagales bacterium]